MISGPNTGGKTVALKTVGLLALMAQAGLPIPAAGGSALKVFDGVYADIGDEQSIEQSLSTFSAHMGNIVDVLSAATGKSLVLLDELGAGTDPQEGAALGKAILSTLTERRAVTVVTTHHSELKGFANVAGGVENANVEFDPATLVPTFRLVVGVPGRSNALAIAERLGLPPTVLETAKNSVGQSAAEVESLLEDIQRRHADAERERAGAEAERRATEAERAALEHEVETLKEEHRQALLEQRVEAQVMAEEMKSRLRHAGRRAKALVNERGRDELARLSTEVNEMRKKLETGPWKDAAPAAAVDGLKTGDLVRVRGLEPVAEVLEVGADGRVHVQAGPLRIEVPPDRIEGRAVRPKTPPKAGYTVDEGVKRRARVGDEFWVHGMRAQQAADAIDEYIEKAVPRRAPPRPHHPRQGAAASSATSSTAPSTGTPSSACSTTPNLTTAAKASPSPRSSLLPYGCLLWSPVPSSPPTAIETRRPSPVGARRDAPVPHQPSAPLPHNLPPGELP